MRLNRLDLADLFPLEGRELLTPRPWVSATKCPNERHGANMHFEWRR
jgi:hypothetical protein